MCPATPGRVEDVYVVVVCGSFAAAEDDDSAIDKCSGVGTTWRRDVALHLRTGPLHRLCGMRDHAFKFHPVELLSWLPYR